MFLSDIPDAFQFPMITGRIRYCQDSEAETLWAG